MSADVSLMGLRIGLSMRVVASTEYEESRDAISHDWCQWLDRRGLVPVLLPNALADARGYLQHAALDALILTGGNDAVAKADGGDFSAPRNATEFAALEFAADTGLPVLGVCRGMHVINLFFGGHVLASLEADAASHIATTHDVHLAAWWPLETPAGSRLRMNSYHSQGIEASGLAPEVREVARSSDGYVEALVHQSLPVVGVQWHPEREQPFPGYDEMLFSSLVKQGAFWT